MNLKAITGNRAVKLLTETFKDWMEDKALRLAAALAYYSVFSIAPMIVIAISVAGLVFGAEAVRGQLDEQMRGYVGGQAANAVQAMVQGASKPTHGWIGAITGVVVLIMGASGVFGQLKDALNTIWEVQATKGKGAMSFLRERLLSFGMVLVIGFLLLISLMLTTAMAALNDFLGRALGVPGAVWTVIGFFLSMAMTSVLFALIFKVLPDAKVRWRNVWVGAVVTAVLFEIGKFGLSFYLGRESMESTYGGAASVVLLLLWIYYASCILLFGAEFTQVYARATGHQIEPSANAVAVTAEKRAQEGLTPASKDDESFSGRPAVETIAVPAPLPGTALAPAGALLLTTAASFVVGLALRRWEEEAQRPRTKLRKGLKDLGEQTLADFTTALHRMQKKAKAR